MKDVAAGLGGRTGGPAADCVGPLPVPPALVTRLRALAHARGTDDLAPLLTCAEELARRVSSDATTVRIGVAHDHEAFVVASHPSQRSPAPTYAQQMSDSTSEAPHDRLTPDVMFVLSGDGRRLYGERLTDSPGGPSALAWTRGFLDLLTESAAAGAPARTRGGGARRGISDLVARQVTLAPDAIAVLDEDGAELTYREFAEQVGRTADRLRTAGAGPGTRIAICMQRGIAQVVAIHAAVATGAGYVPLDLDHPDARLGEIMTDCRPKQVVVDLVGRTHIPDGPWTVVDADLRTATDPGTAAPPGYSPDLPDPAVTLLNILYTSGSTGRPKGVAYPEEGALAHLDWMQRRYPFRSGDTALFKTSPGFDVSIWELFWPLLHGGRLLVCRADRHRDPAHLAELIAAHDVSTVFLPPAVLAPVLEHMGTRRIRGLRWVLSGGEPLTPQLRDAVHTTLPDAGLVHCYGPTEAGTVTDTVVARDSAATVPLGLPAGHFRLPVLDDELRIAPIGVPGEAYVGGAVGLAWGYWGAPGPTAERFVADPFGPAGGRLYRTGDLCSRHDGDVLRHLGRIDRQVKVRGIRVEPGEVEATLTRHPAVARCVVVPEGEPVRLIAFVVSTGPDDDGLGEAVLAHAEAALPVHLRPAAVVPVASVPTNVNGKVDRNVLLDLLRIHEARSASRDTAADGLEATVAGLYRTVLDRDRISMSDTFSRLGGDSVQAFRLLDLLDEQLSAAPDVATLLTGTVRDVAATLRSGPGRAGGSVEQPEGNVE